MTKAILTDIEGTTSSLSFVKDVLFPYARERMAGFVHQHAGEPAVKKELVEVRRLSGKNLSESEIIDQLIRWIDEDEKITPLKSLQGMIWKDGYRQGDFKGHVYEDAVRQLKKWQQAGLKLYIFSSGSVAAQKLLFAHTDYGDLTPLFSGYFDTTVGNKREMGSYQKISGEIGAPAGEILFLSDISEELDAAQEAGMRTMLLTRDGKTPVNSKAHCQKLDFDQIIP